MIKNVTIILDTFARHLYNQLNSLQGKIQLLNLASRSLATLHVYFANPILIIFLG